MEKSAEAFRTISEVAEILDTPAHVLRFWESRFPQIRPVKRAGGRRYYRPADVALLAGIRRLLHDEGMTIRGVQKILREQGVRHVSSLGGHDPGPALSDQPGEDGAPTGFGFEEPAEPRGEVVPFAREAVRAATTPLRAEALPRPPFAAGELRGDGAVPGDGGASAVPDEGQSPVVETRDALAETPSRGDASGGDQPVADVSQTERPVAQDHAAEPSASRAAATGDEAPSLALDLGAGQGMPLASKGAAAASEAAEAFPATLPPEPPAAESGSARSWQMTHQGTAKVEEAPVWSPPEPLVPRGVAASAGPGSVASSERPLSDDSVLDGAPPWRPTRVRSLARGALVHRREDVLRLCDALRALHQRLRGAGDEAGA